jgi:hypothetical protein
MSDRNPSLVPKPDQAIVRQFLELVDGIDRDDPSPADIRALREMLRDHPDLWRVCGDLAQIAAATLIQRLKALPHVAESLKCGWTAMKDDLGYSVALPLERLLIEEVVLSSMHNYLVAAEYSAAMGLSISQSSVKHWERRLSAAQSRFLRACVSLARIRKLARTTPALQLNVAAYGGQQVNVVTDQPESD